MQTFVKIVNRENGYTNVRKAADYISRGLAEAVSVSERGQLLEIRMLEAAELAAMRTRRRSDADPVKGSFGWFVADSGGSFMTRTEGFGGMRVLQASHGQ